MIGHRLTPPATNNPEAKNRAAVPVGLALLSGERGVPAASFFFTYAARRPDLIDPITRGKASAENGGRGTFSVANKKSQTNILNALPRIVVSWGASQTQRSPMTRNILSSPIPLGK